MPADQEFEGQTAMVVGAANGLGKSAATLLSGRGATVALLDRDAGAVQRMARSFRAAGREALGRGVDVMDAVEVEVATKDVEQRLGRVDILVNCAGITGVTARRSEEVEVEDFDLVYRVNLRGAFLLSKAVLPGMALRGYGRVLHIASIAGKEGNAGMVAYSAAKAGLIGMVKAQGKEYAETGVTINALAPAVVRTAMVDAMPESQVEYMTQRIPMKRTGTLTEAAEAICWAVSPACSFTTGFTFDLSGGRAVY